MKTIIRNSRFASFLFVTLVLTHLAMASRTDSSINENPIELKLVSQSKENSIFELKINPGVSGNDYIVLIRDAQGTNYFKDNFKSAVYSKKFLFNMDELGDDTLELEVYNRKTKESVVYAINRNVKLVEEILVSKL